MKLTHSWSFRASENRWPACFWPNVTVSWASASKVRWLRSATSTSIGVCILRNLWLRLDMSVGRTRHSGFTLVSILSLVFYWLSRLNSGGEVHLCHDDSFRAGDCCTVGWKLIHSLIGILIIWWFVVLAFWRLCDFRKLVSGWLHLFSCCLRSRKSQWVCRETSGWSGKIGKLGTTHLCQAWTILWVIAWISQVSQASDFVALDRGSQCSLAGLSLERYWTKMGYHLLLWPLSAAVILMGWLRPGCWSKFFGSQSGRWFGTGIDGAASWEHGPSALSSWANDPRFRLHHDPKKHTVFTSAGLLRHGPIGNWHTCNMVPGLSVGHRMFPGKMAAAIRVVTLSGVGLSPGQSALQSLLSSHGRFHIFITLRLLTDSIPIIIVHGIPESFAIASFPTMIAHYSQHMCCG